METKETKEEGTNEKIFKSFGQKVDQFVVELNEAAEKLQKEFQHKYDELRASAEKAKKEIENKDRWKEVEDNLKSAGDELKEAFKAAFRKKQ
jgi:uncharacterized iron-regulated protein